MPSLMGDNLLPDSVVSRRRQLRERVRDMRQPVRQFRERNVPGPDVLGKAEDQFRTLRNKVVSRETALEKIRARRAGSGTDDGTGSDNSDSDVDQMT